MEQDFVSEKCIQAACRIVATLTGEYHIPYLGSEVIHEENEDGSPETGIELYFTDPDRNTMKVDLTIGVYDKDVIWCVRDSQPDFIYGVKFPSNNFITGEGRL